MPPAVASRAIMPASLSCRSHAEAHHAFGHMRVHRKDLPFHDVISRAERFQIDRQRVVTEPAQFSLAHDLAGFRLDHDLAESELQTFGELDTDFTRRFL